MIIGGWVFGYPLLHPEVQWLKATRMNYFPTQCLWSLAIVGVSHSGCLLRLWLSRAEAADMEGWTEPLGPLSKVTSPSWQVALGSCSGLSSFPPGSLKGCRSGDIVGQFPPAKKCDPLCATEPGLGKHLSLLPPVDIAGNAGTPLSHCEETRTKASAGMDLLGHKGGQAAMHTLGKSHPLVVFFAHTSHCCNGCHMIFW
jgi:hypothetical protein